MPLINLPVSSNLKLRKSLRALCPPANPDRLPIVAQEPTPKGFARSDKCSYPRGGLCAYVQIFSLSESGILLSSLKYFQYSESFLF